MTCPTCGNTAVENTANHKTFFYCRTCKTEVDEYFLSDDPTDFDLTDAEWAEIERTLGSDTFFDDDGDDFTGDDMS